jgi:methyl-accepting chemotaxis protein
MPASQTKTKTKAKAKAKAVPAAQLNEQLAFANAMSDNSPINIIRANTDLQIEYINEASRATLRRIEHLLPIKVDAMLGQSIDIFHKDPSHQRRILSNPQNLPHRSIIELGGEKLDLLVSATYDRQGTYLGPMVTWDIVTDRLKMEERSADFAGQLAAISASQAVIEFQMDGTIVTANSNFCNALGLLVGRNSRATPSPVRRRGL